MRFTGEEADDGLPWEGSDSSPDLLARVHGDVPRTPSVTLAHAVQPSAPREPLLDWTTQRYRLRNPGAALVVVVCAIVGVVVAVIGFFVSQP